MVPQLVPDELVLVLSLLLAAAESSTTRARVLVNLSSSTVHKNGAKLKRGALSQVGCCLGVFLVQQERCWCSFVARKLLTIVTTVMQEAVGLGHGLSLCTLHID